MSARLDPVSAGRHRLHRTEEGAVVLVGVGDLFYGQEDGVGVLAAHEQQAEHLVPTLPTPTTFLAMSTMRYCSSRWRRSACACAGRPGKSRGPLPPCRHPTASGTAPVPRDPIEAPLPRLSLSIDQFAESA